MFCSIETTPLGSTELQVSRLGFGAARIDADPEEEVATLLHRTLDLGINLIDTADCYALSEERIGRALESRRQEMVLATKRSAVARLHGGGGRIGYAGRTAE
ncbi:MAG: aldo/keto reductase [Candidatus Latescibacteria bacterium]|nr:aldo/keto reductase [Candidatus Latescibacterota bacterium]